MTEVRKLISLALVASNDQIFQLSKYIKKITVLLQPSYNRCEAYIKIIKQILNVFNKEVKEEIFAKHGEKHTGKSEAKLFCLTSELAT
jgi:hypothetical protein